MSEELKPCPFCGCEEAGPIDIENGHVIECYSCGSVGSLHKTLAQAITSWNTRASAWVSVEEPPQMKLKGVMLVWLAMEDGSVEEYHFEPEVSIDDGVTEGLFFDDEGYQPEENEVVPTHWRPRYVPPHPKEKQ